MRHSGRIEAALGRLIAHPPRFITRAVLLVAGYELIEAPELAEDEGRRAKIIHHAVEQAKQLASPAEARLVNAVARKLAAALAAQVPPGALAPAEALAEYFSHPAWMVRRWFAEFGGEATRLLLRWNQEPAPLYARRLGSGGGPARPGCGPAAWPAVVEVPSGPWGEVEPLLAAQTIYVQDPSTRIAVELLDPRPGEAVLDLRAAPGGKSLLAADRMEGKGKLVAVDLPGPRMARLRENLSGLAGVEATVLEGDILHELDGLLRRHRLPSSFSAVLLDAPCTNTGVMRHRIDVKWRLQEGDFRSHARQQGALLAAASRWVAPGGRLVYSTCSIDAEENKQVVAAFLERSGGGFVQEEESLFYPWTANHDGGAAFRLRRRATAPDPRTFSSTVLTWMPLRKVKTISPGAGQELLVAAAVPFAHLLAVDPGDQVAGLDLGGVGGRAVDHADHAPVDRGLVEAQPHLADAGDRDRLGRLAVKDDPVALLVETHGKVAEDAAAQGGQLVAQLDDGPGDRVLAQGEAVRQPADLFHPVAGQGPDRSGPRSGRRRRAGRGPRD